jgi:phage major head subunit gpT-like protein
MQPLNYQRLQAINTGFNTAFDMGFSAAETFWRRVAMRVTSKAAGEDYGWLQHLPALQEWIGPREVNALSVAGYSIKNADFESTISVPRNTLEDDTYGVMSPLFQDFGRVAAEHPDTLIGQLFTKGFTDRCYDGQNFFDTDHPVTDKAGNSSSVSNVQSGSGEPWFLLDVSRAIRPFIYQERRPFVLVSKDRLEDDNVFFNKEFVYGVDGRCNVGFGLWQLAFGSKAELSAANYGAARASMMKLTGENGRKLGIRPRLLVVGPDNESKARKLLNSELASGGESNEWRGTADLIVTPWIE